MDTGRSHLLNEVLASLMGSCNVRPPSFFVVVFVVAIEGALLPTNPVGDRGTDPYDFGVL